MPPLGIQIGISGGASTSGGFNPSNPDFTGLLDEYSGAAAAYSVRKLSSTHTGSALRVREDANGSEQDIGFDSSGSLDTLSLMSFVGTGVNLLSRSNKFDTNWQTTRYNVTDGQEGYDGSEDAWLIDKTDEDNTYLRQNSIPNVDSDSFYTTSVYAKKGTLNVLMIYVNGYIRIDLRDGSLQSQGGVFHSYNVDSVGDGWYRISITMETNMPDRVYFKPVADNGTDTSGSVYIQDAQLNPGEEAATYVETTTGQAGYGYVTTWYDQSGSGNNAANTNAAQQPKIVKDGTLVQDGNKPGVDFDGVVDHLDVGITLTGGFHIFYVHQSTKTSGFEYLLYNGSDQIRLYDYLWRPFINSVNYPGGISNDGFDARYLWEFARDDSANIRNYRNDSQDAFTSGVPIAGVDGADFTINSIGAVSNTIQGPVQEVVLFGVAQSDRSGIATNINDYFSIYTP